MYCFEDKYKFLNGFKAKKVFITGHTGFKGSWLAYILHECGSIVKGYSLKPEDQECHYNQLGLSRLIESEYGDITDRESLKKSLESFQPEYVFHLAAQALVSRSYDNPYETFNTNMMGSLNILEAVRSCKTVRSLVYITSDKCYENVEWIWGYRETDKLGGRDAYSASKAAAEIIYSSYRIFSLWVLLCCQFQTHEIRLKQNDILFHSLLILKIPCENFNLTKVVLTRRSIKTVH